MRRRLDAELVRRGLVVSRSGAAEAIRSGRVLVGGAPAATPARQVAASEAITVTGPRPRFVSRGGEKLDAALQRFGVDVSDRRALDAGASTGGFTDCLLQAGAAHVYAVDVGRGQLAWTIRRDPRVTVLERVNVRGLEPEMIGGPVEVVTADLSFISLLTVAAALVRCATPAADLVLLVKPQFEAGRARVGKGGVVRDPYDRLEALVAAGAAAQQTGMSVQGYCSSGLPGPAGNLESFMWCTEAAREGEHDLVAAASVAEPQAALGVRG
jgi:23S rRNA (cytidine1920-2'-O)/16S rRNA (cytidine1409-2'-O)-methyltransferase